MAETIRCSMCASYRRHVCWLVDRRPYCNRCYGKLYDEKGFDIFHHSIHRVTENEKFFEDSPRARKNPYLEARDRIMAQS